MPPAPARRMLPLRARADDVTVARYARDVMRRDATQRDI